MADKEKPISHEQKESPERAGAARAKGLTDAELQKRVRRKDLGRTVRDVNEVIRPPTDSEKSLIDKGWKSERPTMQDVAEKHPRYGRQINRLGSVMDRAGLADKGTVSSISEGIRSDRSASSAWKALYPEPHHFTQTPADGLIRSMIVGQTVDVQGGTNRALGAASAEQTANIIRRTNERAARTVKGPLTPDNTPTNEGVLRRTLLGKMRLKKPGVPEQNTKNNRTSI